MISRLTALAILVFFAAGDATAQRTAGTHVDDSTLHSSVKYALADAKGVPSGRINVEVYSGAVQISGFLESDEQKKLALEAAKGVEGVERLDDSLVVMEEDRSFGASVDDQVTLASVETAIGKATSMGDAMDVVTKVRNGEVLLAGFVKNDEVRTKAGEAAAGVKNVTKVHNKISLKK